MAGNGSVPSSGLDGLEPVRLTQVADEFLVMSNTAAALSRHILNAVGTANGGGASAIAYDQARAATDELDQFAAAAKSGRTLILQTILEQRKRTGGGKPGQDGGKPKPASIWTNWNAPFLPEGHPTPSEFGKTSKEVTAYWESLPEEVRRLYIEEYPNEIGWLNGIPTPDRNLANLNRLSAYVSDPANQGDPMFNAARDVQNLLRESNRPLYLVGFDPKGDGKVIISMGDMDTARDVVFYAPGVGNEMKDVRNLLMDKGAHVFDTAKEMDKDRSLAYVLFLYDTPKADTDAVQQDLARKGAAEFVPFLQSWRETNPYAHASVIGHSYGSVMVGTAAAAGQMRGLVDDLIFAGSPGLTVDNVSGLKFNPGHVWVIANPQQDVIANPDLAPLITSDEAGRYARQKGASVAGSAGGWVAENIARVHALQLGSAAGFAADPIHGPKPHTQAFGANVILVSPGEYVSLGEAAIKSHSAYWDLKPGPTPSSLPVPSEGLAATASIVRGEYHKNIWLDYGSLPRPWWWGRQ